MPSPSFSPSPSASPRRVAMVITELEPGGAERAFVELVTRLNRQRFLPQVYCLSPPPKSASLVRRLRDCDIAIEFLGAKRTWGVAAVVRRLRRQFRRDRPELVQSFLYHANIAARFAVSRDAKIPVVCGVRVAERRGRLRLWVDRVSAGRVAKWVCVSQAVADFSREPGRLPADKLVVIPNGVDVEAICAAEPIEWEAAGLQPGQRVLLFVGRLDEQKGVLALVRHADALLERLPGHDLVIAGRGPLASELREKVDGLAQASRIHLLGFRADIPALLRACDVLLVPSRWEGMPNVVLEAMAAGRPVVATDVEGVREALGPQADQQVVARDDLPALCERAAALASDPSLAARLGHANQVRASEQFSWSVMVAAYELLYAELLAAHES